jgi:hypothetical protein
MQKPLTALKKDVCRQDRTYELSGWDDDFGRLEHFGAKAPNIKGLFT